MITPGEAKIAYQEGKHVQYRNDERYKGLPLEWTDLPSTGHYRFESCYEYRILPVVADSALDVQVGGSHYKDMSIQPIEYIRANDLGFFEGNAIKYLTRWKSKGGIQDLEKAKHYIEMLIEFETKHRKEYLDDCRTNR